MKTKREANNSGKREPSEDQHVDQMGKADFLLQKRGNSTSSKKKPSVFLPFHC